MATYDISTTDLSGIKFKTGDIINCPYTGSMKSVKLPKGIFKFEVWGAQGGTYSSYYGGAGGYSYGELSINEEITAFLYAGGQPTTSTDSSVIIEGGFNGGGKARYHSYSGTTSYCQAGGGASDIRIGQDSLYSRIIVAGGGGGSSSGNSLSTKCGGGLTGKSPTSGYSSSQTAAGTNGSFGIGGDGYTSGYNYKYASGGGGGGWYGGGGCSSHSDSTNYRNYNGGGSGYVYTSSTATNYPSGCLLDSAMYLTNAETIAGDTAFTSPTGTSETGHTGNGYVRITVIKTSELNLYVKIDGTWIKCPNAYAKVNGSWKKISSIYEKGGSTEWQ